MASERDTWSSFLKQLFYYHTVKVVQIRSWKLGLLYYFVVICIAVYVGFWAIYWERGYQSTGDLVGNTAVKVKGNSYWLQPNDQPQIWDASDVVFPPKEPDALFITTNFYETVAQTRTNCSGIDNTTESCQFNPHTNKIDYCAKWMPTANGINTGVCNTTSSMCQIYAWCDIESIPANETRLLVGVNNFTVFIRVTVKFPKWGVSRDNANGTGNALTPGYNLFSIDDMVSRAGYSYNELSRDGGAFAVIINWDCDLDMSYDKCIPKISFVRVDDPKPDSVSRGYNFRYANYYYLPDPENATNFREYRDLLKVFGLRFIFIVSGQARKFDVVPLLINIGSGLALLSVATVVSDFITLFILPDKKFYNRVKFETVDEAQQKKKRVKPIDNTNSGHHTSLPGERTRLLNTHSDDIDRSDTEDGETVASHAILDSTKF